MAVGDIKHFPRGGFKMNKSISVAVLLTGMVLQPVSAQITKAQLGELLFFDTTLSEPSGQACASCHDPAAGFADPDQHLPVSEGVIPGRFGTRNSPSASYALFYPEFTLKSGIQGGQFWDGRAANLTEQAKGPFLNPVEMNNPDRASVIAKILATDYAAEFESICGPSSNTDAAYQCMAEAIADFESTAVFRAFSSRYDAVKAGLASFTAQEAQGEALFNGRAKCAHCHSLGGGNSPDLFTDSKFHNIGLPPNPEIFQLRPDLPADFRDLGLGAVLNDPKQNGKFKTVHIRNVALTPPYMHNGVLKTLKDVVHFYNTRDIPGEWPAPEVPETVDGKFLGDLGLTDQEEDAIVSFMETLSDGYLP
jgi:cytochrome c peroxidase